MNDRFASPSFIKFRDRGCTPFEIESGGDAITIANAAVIVSLDDGKGG